MCNILIIRLCTRSKPYVQCLTGPSFCGFTATVPEVVRATRSRPIDSAELLKSWGTGAHGVVRQSLPTCYFTRYF